MNHAPVAQLSSRDFVSASPEQTFNFGFQIGERLNGGEILLLSGPLGAGKTILVKGICAALGIDEEEVTSPSFTLVNPYEGRLRLYHIDLYRLDEGVLPHMRLILATCSLMKPVSSRSSGPNG